jgi:hypothetical protein
MLISSQLQTIATNFIIVQLKHISKKLLFYLKAFEAYPYSNQYVVEYLKVLRGSPANIRLYFASKAGA